jgi:oxygen-independent coproporphyrinogen-3 oxidase
LELRPDRLSVFGYAHVPTFKKHQRKIAEPDLPDGHGRFAQAQAIAGALVAAGYVRIGFDHYALPGDPLQLARANGVLRRNFQGYTADGCTTLIAFGASSIGRLPQGYVQNETNIRWYADQIGNGDLATAKGYAMTADDLVRADIIQRLMCDLEVDVGQIADAHAVSGGVFAQARPQLEALAREGLVHLDRSRIRIPEECRLLVRMVASIFDTHLPISSRTYSRTV